MNPSHTKETAPAVVCRPIAVHHTYFGARCAYFAILPAQDTFGTHSSWRNAPQAPLFSAAILAGVPYLPLPEMR